MTLIRWRPTGLAPLQEFAGLQDDLNRMFDSFFAHGGLRGDLNAVFAPAVDIDETPEEFVIRADLPGVAQQDVKVSLMGDTVTIRGERHREAERKDRSQHRVERAYGTFERSFTLGAPVRNDKVKAQVRDGVLEVHIPKAEEARVREIEVQVA